MGTTRLYYRFSADNTFAVNGLHFLKGVEHIPMPCGELYGILAEVFDANGIAERIVHLVVFEEGALKSGADRNFDSFGDLCKHINYR